MLLPLAVPLLLAGCSDPAAGPTRRGADRVPAARVVGPAATCIPLTAFRETQVRDGQTIDFLAGRRGWRTTLPARCPGLTIDRSFTYATSITQLCSMDIIRVLQRLGPDLVPGAACGLGPFVPIELPERS
ncbi:hypothetical protein ACFOON_09095 [Novosphingobium piscinae]|uniref:hypothetical protein n=1 Tax=Novosphingobium piscinae TaxID=1507448 RepID=UPI00361B27E4